jgi:PIN domain nuclease of toxin-antitoxin system
MAETVHLDTHLVIWIAMKEHHRLPETLIKRINVSTLMISPAVILEFQYLVETKKIEGNPLKIIEKLQALIGLEICKDPFESVIRESLNLSWTRDPFDRMIVAQALIAKTVLLTKDREIRRHYSRAIWE